MPDEFLIRPKPGAVFPLSGERSVGGDWLRVEADSPADLWEFAVEVVPNEDIAFRLTADLPGIVGETEEAESWGFKFLGLSDVHALGADGRGVSIGIIDSGQDTTHEALEHLHGAGLLAEFAEFNRKGDQVFESSSSPVVTKFGHWHGTFVAGILAGRSPSGLTIGSAPRARFWVVKVLGDDNYGSTAAIMAGLYWLLERRLDFINMSIGWEGLKPHWATPIRLIAESGTVVFAGVGNEADDSGRPQSRSPANFPFMKDPLRLIAVGALGREGGEPYVWEGSSREAVDWTKFEHDSMENPFLASPLVNVPDLVAPGSGIISSGYDDKYLSEVGTSYATPYTVGATAAILSALRSKNAAATPDDAVRELLGAIEPGNESLETGRGWITSSRLLQVVNAILA